MKLKETKARTISINQQAYIESVVEKFRLTGTKKVLTPMDLNMHFSTQQCLTTLTQTAQTRGIPYSEAIGSVLWSTVVSCPDTAYAIRVLSQFIQSLGPAHQEGVKRLISYLGHMKDLWLTFGGSKHTLLKGYYNANWVSQPHHLGTIMDKYPWMMDKFSRIWMISTYHPYHPQEQ